MRSWRSRVRPGPDARKTIAHAHLERTEVIMKRRELLKKSAAFGFVTALPFSTASELNAVSQPAVPPADIHPLKPPDKGMIPVAFVISAGAVVIDFCGPWEVFQDVIVPGTMGTSAFDLYTVGETLDPIKASGGLQIVPDHTFQTAPQPKVIVIPAQNNSSPAMLDWIRKASKNADLTMSVCTGAIVLANTGLLAGKTATTHHDSYRTMALQYPDIHIQRGARFVDDGHLASSGGLSSGIDLAFHVVERYYGRDLATLTAYRMEYQGKGWQNPDSNVAYAPIPTGTAEHPLCPVCWMKLSKDMAMPVEYQGKTLYFCSQAHIDLFMASPAKFLNAK